MAFFSPKVVNFVKLENKRQRLNVEDCDCAWSIPMLTAGLGRRGAPTLVSLYKPKTVEHGLARAELFDQAAVNCFKYPVSVKGKLMHVRQALDFIREQCLIARLPQDIWHGLFEKQHKRFLSQQDSGELQFNEEFLMAYIKSLEAAVLALETEGAIAMFAEGEQVMADSLTLKMYFPFSDAMEQQDLIDKGVQNEIESQVLFGAFRFFKSLSIPITRQLLVLRDKLILYGKRTYRCCSDLTDPFYSANIFRRTLIQANSWFYAEVDRVTSLINTKANSHTEFRRRFRNPPDWLFYEETAMSQALKTRDTKEEHDFILQTKQKMVGWGAYHLDDFFRIFWELQERERQLSILIKVEAWVKCH